eukprot:scaffold85168_cov19-Prasinocladus_malaysianus.AAC.3
MYARYATIMDDSEFEKAPYDTESEALREKREAKEARERVVFLCLGALSLGYASITADRLLLCLMFVMALAAFAARWVKEEHEQAAAVFGTCLVVLTMACTCLSGDLVLGCLNTATALAAVELK